MMSIMHFAYASLIYLPGPLFNEFRLFSKKTFVFVAIISILQCANVSYGVTVDRVLATVGDEAITFADYRQFVKGIGENENAEEIDGKLLKRLIEEKIILKEAKRKGIEIDDAEIDRSIEEFKSLNGLSQEDLENFLREEAISISDYKKLLKERILLSRLINLEVDSKIIVKEKEVADFYYENKRDFLITPETVRIQAIFLSLGKDATVTEITDLKRRALKIASRLKDGENFDILVDEYSDEPLKSQGGMLGTFVRGALVPPLDEKVFTLKEGEVSEPLWGGEGVYILKLTEKIPEKFRALEEVKGELYNDIYEQKREQLFNQWVKTLWEKATVIIK